MSSSLPELTAHTLAADMIGFMSCMPPPFTSAPLFRSTSPRARSLARAAWLRLSFFTRVHPAVNTAAKMNAKTKQMPGLLWSTRMDADEGKGMGAKKFEFSVFQWFVCIVRRSRAHKSGSLLRDEEA